MTWTFGPTGSKGEYSARETVSFEEIGRRAKPCRARTIRIRNWERNT